MPAAELLNLLAEGLLNTLALVAASLPPAVVIGTTLGTLRACFHGRLRALLDAIADVLRGLPLLALLYAFTYGLPELGLRLQPLAASALALILCSSAYLSEYVRVGVLSSAEGEILAAQSLGASRLQVLRYVVAPHLLKTTLPAIANEAVYLLQATTLAGLVGVYELFSAARTYNSKYFDFWTPAVALVAIYTALSVTVEKAITASGTLGRRWLKLR